ncbi:MAG: hypothetical protein AB8G05_17650 [Oligoflexales bacterium]
MNSYLMSVAVANHVVSAYNNWSTCLYRDFLIKCNDSLKVSLEALQKTDLNFEIAQDELGVDLKFTVRPEKKYWLLRINL